MQRLRIVGVPAPVDISITHLMCIRFAEHGGKDEKKIMTTTGPEQGTTLCNGISRNDRKTA